MSFEKTFNRGRMILKGLSIFAGQMDGVDPDKLNFDRLDFYTSHLNDPDTKNKLKGVIRETFPDAGEDLVEKIDLGLRIAKGMMKFAKISAALISGDPNLIRHVAMNEVMDMLLRNDLARQRLIMQLVEDGDHDPDDHPPPRGSKRKLMELPKASTAVATTRIATTKVASGNGGSFTPEIG